MPLKLFEYLAAMLPDPLPCTCGAPADRGALVVLFHNDGISLVVMCEECMRTVSGDVMHRLVTRVLKSSPAQGEHQYIDVIGRLIPLQKAEYQ